MTKPRGAATKPSQHEVNCLAAFIEAAEELKHEPFYSPDNQGSLIYQGGKLIANLGDRFHFRSALITFRRIWMEKEASNFKFICNLIDRFEGEEIMIRIARDQFKHHTSMRWQNLPINAGDIINLWLNGVFAHVSLKSKKWRNRIDFEKLLKTHGHASLEFKCRTTVSAVGIAFFNLLTVARPTLKRWERDFHIKPEFEICAPFGRTQVEVSAEGHTIIRRASTEHTLNEAADQKFNRILSRRRFYQLKSILQNASSERSPLREIVITSVSYSDLLAKLGNIVVIDELIDLNEYYSRVGLEGGIQAVLPYDDAWSNTSFPTVVTMDKKVITTCRAICIFDKQLKDFKRQLTAD